MNPERMKQIVIVGGGAAGLAAAIFTAEKVDARYTRIFVLDGAASIGAKILVSGGGRCNVTNKVVTENDYFANPNIVRGVLKRFSELDTVKWFNSLDVRLKIEDTDKLFPVTDKAQTILHALLKRAKQLNVRICSNERVTRIEPRNNQFTISHTSGKTIADTLIMATGGQSLPKTGSDGAGWRIIKTLNHTVTPTCPALVPLMLNESFFHEEVSGVSLNVQTSVHVDGKCIDKRTGSMLWTHFGISGPVVMDASRFWVKADQEEKSPQFFINFLPDETFESVEKKLVDATRDNPRRQLGSLLSSPLPKRLAITLIESLDMEPDMPLHSLTRECRRDIVHALLELEVPVERHRGWNTAEVTAGGVPLDEIDRNTMMSRHHDQLYLVGEILDCDGRIGGFNFQWAWSTGYIAAQAIAKSYQNTSPTTEPQNEPQPETALESETQTNPESESESQPENNSPES